MGALPTTEQLVLSGVMLLRLAATLTGLLQRGLTSREDAP